MSATRPAARADRANDATCDALTRLEPLDDQIARVADAVAVSGDPDSEHWQRLVAAVEQVRSDARGEYGCLLEREVKTVEVELANHERLDLRGAHKGRCHLRNIRRDCGAERGRRSRKNARR